MYVHSIRGLEFTNPSTHTYKQVVNAVNLVPVCSVADPDPGWIRIPNLQEK